MTSARCRCGRPAGCCPISRSSSTSTRRPARRRLDADDKPFDRLEAEKSDFHARVRAGFLTLAEREPDRFVVLDATQPPEVLAARVRDAVSARVS